MNYFDYVKERNSAIIKAVVEDDWDAVIEYCHHYNITVPDDKTTMQAGVYKACQECTDIPDDVKYLAALKCFKLGFDPYMYDD